MRTRCSSIRLLVPATLALAAAGAPLRALAEEPRKAPAEQPAPAASAPAASAPAPLPPAPAPPPGSPPKDPTKAAGEPPGPATPGAPPPYKQYLYPYPYPYLPPVPLIPPTLPYIEGRPTPGGYHIEERANQPLMITGLSLSLLAYGISLVVGLTFVTAGGSHSEEFAPLLVPLAGPFIALGTLKEFSATMTLDGVTQSAGVLLAVIGAFATEKILVRNDRSSALAVPELLVGPGSAAVRWQF